MQDDIRLALSLFRPTDTFQFDEIGCITQASGIDQGDVQTKPDDLFFDNVASRAGDVGHNSSALTE